MQYCGGYLNTGHLINGSIPILDFLVSGMQGLGYVIAIWKPDF